jgi:hypothetical protein
MFNKLKIKKTMKKTFKYFTFMLLSLAVLGISLKSWAAVPRPSGSPLDGYEWTLQNDVVQFKILGWNGDIKDKNDKEIGAFEVEIAGLDYTGITTKPEALTIKTVGTMKYGEKQFNYVVTKIAGTTPEEGKSFYGQRNLKSVVFANDESLIKNDQFTVEVGNYAFFGCDAMTTLTLPDNVKTIGDRAFEGSAITNFVIPSQCEKIGQFAFNDTEKLKTVSVSTNGNKVLTKIEKKVFANSYVQELDLSNAYVLEEIEDDAFIFESSKVNNQLKTVKLPASHLDADKKVVEGGPTTFKTMGSAFANCTALTTIENLELSVVPVIRRGTSSAYSAFENCRSLTSLFLPATATIEGGLTKPISAFYGCKSLATLKFATGWAATIGQDIYAGYKRVDGAIASLSENEQKAEKSYLKQVIFDGTVAGGAIIGYYAFRNCENLATLTFTKGLAPGDAVGGITINPYAFAGTALTKVDFNGTSFAGVTDATVSIAQNAFVCENLEEVAFGNIAYANADGSATEEFVLANGAFKSDNLKKVTFGNITASQTTSKLQIGSGYQVCRLLDGSESADVLEEVTFGNMTVGNFTIDELAFRSKALKTVTIGNITTLANTDGILNIKKYAFGTTATSDPAGAQEKTVLIAWDTEKDKAGTIGVTPKAGTDITATLTVNFGENAFTGHLLKTVKIGDINGGAEVTAEANSFQNATANGKKFTAMSETVKIGNIGYNDNKEGKIELKANALTAPQKEGSSFELTIGDVKGTVVTATNAVYAPQNGGTTTLTLGNIAKTADLSGIAGNSFTGSTDGATPTPTNTTSVTLGNVAKGVTLPTTVPFTNVYDATVGKWSVTTSPLELGMFDGVVEATVGTLGTGSKISDMAGTTLETMNFLGEVPDANAIANFNSPAVRKITFVEDAKVATGAFAGASFQNAGAAAAGAKEQIVVVYKMDKTTNTKAIFAVNTFGASATDAKSVVLYTDDWSKQRIFLNSSVYPVLPYRMEVSASDVVPGADITAKCVAKSGDKYAYGKLYIPAGSNMYYKVEAKKDENNVNTVNIFSATIDGEDIYMKQVDIYNGCFWIDATKANQTFIVRTSDLENLTITAVGATADEIEEINTDFYWFGQDDADKNVLRYATADIANQNLQNDPEFMNKGIFVMANPAKNGLAFIKLDQYAASQRDLAKGSVYIVTKKSSADRLNIIWSDEAEEATAIRTIEKANSENGAIYNLQGIRLKSAQKGIYIQNGKKYVK